MFLIASEVQQFLSQMTEDEETEAKRQDKNVGKSKEQQKQRAHCKLDFMR